ncbi:hypothetical protein RvY_05698 [Ramazzottius varieornatus]|uniref:Phosphate transporter n=1 Tax=Ramazzottius varieornatus TaxID=947166 RepID=A0A1D1UVZ4_RAMVA|nr:hypothetical protein RvY_05698 [Ramazzottius varieornatus]
MDPHFADVVWMVVVGFIIAFILAFAVGANDVANSFGTSVGSKVLTLKQACILAVIFETLGAILIGSKVSDTIWKDIVDVQIYKGEERILMLGELAALISAAVWLMIATVMKIPVSGTHSIVGATMGFSLVYKGAEGIQWMKLVKIVASWFVSPILAGVVSSCFFLFIQHFILRRENHLEPALHAMPFFYGLTVFVNCLSVFLDGAPMLSLDRIPWWGALIICFGTAIITALFVWLYVVPRQRIAILKKVEAMKANGTTDVLTGTIPFATPSVSLASSVVDLRRSIKKPTKSDMATSMNDVKSLLNANKGKGTMSASTSMTGLSRAQSFINTKMAGEDVPLASVHEHPDENEHAVDLAEVAKVVSDYPGILKHDTDVNHVHASLPSSVEITVQNEVSERAPLTSPAPTMHFRPKVANSSTTDDTKITEANTRTNGTKVVEVKMHPGRPRPAPLGGSTFGLDTPTEEPPRNATWLCCGPCRRNDKCCIPMDRKGRPRLASVHRVKDPLEVQVVFSFLQIMTAAFTAFAHGGNDVCNAIGPLVALWVVFEQGVIPESSTTPIWLLLFGGFGISVGLSVLGRKVIETVGTNLTPVIPSSGFCIGLGTACTVLVASKIGLPISTTHCIVGSVVAVGWLRSQSQVNWKLFRNILFGWFVTLPVTVGVSAAAMAILVLLVK